MMYVRWRSFTLRMGSLLYIKAWQIVLNKLLDFEISI